LGGGPAEKVLGGRSRLAEPWGDVEKKEFRETKPHGGTVTKTPGRNCGGKGVAMGDPPPNPPKGGQDPTFLHNPEIIRKWNRGEGEKTIDARARKKGSQGLITP